MAKFEEGEINTLDLSGTTVTNISAYDGSYYINTTGFDSSICKPNDTLHVDGKLNVQGRDIMEELDEIRDVLLLLRRDVDMEEKYPRLKQLKEEYQATLEKYKTFESLKGKK